MTEERERERGYRIAARADGKGKEEGTKERLHARIPPLVAASSIYNFPFVRIICVLSILYTLYIYVLT